MATQGSNVPELDIQPVRSNEKGDTFHDENAEDKAIQHELLKSRFDEMSIPRTLWVFRKSAFFVFSVYMGYLCEGFEVRSHTIPQESRSD
jgi:hypothetical protein